MEKVQVYFNLHKKVFSVRDAKTRKVIAHVREIDLSNVEFKVSQAGRRRVLFERRKNVHAYAEGFVSAIPYKALCNRRVTYNPYTHDSFIECEGGAEVYKANRARLELSGDIPRVFI